MKRHRRLMVETLLNCGVAQREIERRTGVDRKTMRRCEGSGPRSLKLLHPGHRLERLAGEYPLDIDAWYQLGEVRMHSAPLRGRPLVAATRPLERVLDLTPRHREALLHVMRLYAHAGRYDESDSLGRRLADVEVVKDAPTENGFTVWAVGSDAARDAFANALARRAAVGLWEMANQEAERRLRFPGILSPSTFVALRAALALAPFGTLAYGPRHLAVLRDSLVTWKGEVVGPVGIVDVPLDVLDTAFRWYPAGLLSARLGDSLSAARHAGRLRDPALVERSKKLSAALSRSVMAEIATSRGRPADALRLLVDSQPPIPLERQVSFYGVLAYERWARAEALTAAGQLDEALRWYESMAVTSIHEAVYLAPSHPRRAQIHERLGAAEEAARHYSRFALLWSEADPSLRPLVDDAQRRAATLAARD